VAEKDNNTTAASQKILYAKRPVHSKIPAQRTSTMASRIIQRFQDGPSWMRRASVRLSRFEYSSHSWFRVAGVFGVGIASAGLVSSEASQREEKSQGKRKRLTSADDASSPKPGLFAAPSFTYPIPRFTQMSFCDCDAGRFSFLGRTSRLRRSNTILQYKSEVSKESVRSRYKVNWKKPLGQGGFGAVYSAIDRRTGEKVALKQISKKYTDNVAFQREMDAFLHLRRAGGHPNICGLHENFDEGNYFYFSLDLISGGEMFDHLIRSGPYSEHDASRLVREVASALNFMHGIGFVHG
jgi:hypothetical protein